MLRLHSITHQTAMGIAFMAIDLLCSSCSTKRTCCRFHFPPGIKAVCQPFFLYAVYLFSLFIFYINRKRFKIKESMFMCLSTIRLSQSNFCQYNLSFLLQYPVVVLPDKDSLLFFDSLHSQFFNRCRHLRALKSILAILKKVSPV